MKTRTRTPVIRPLLENLDRVGSRWLEERLARGDIEDVLPLHGGPVKPLPGHAREEAIAALDEPGRRPSRGLPELREAIARSLLEETGVSVDPDREILITTGAMQALNVVFRALLSPGDQALVPTPGFYLDGITRLAGAEPVYVPCRQDDGWRWDLDRIEAAVTPVTKVLFACNPVNPTGYLPTGKDLEALAAMAERHGFAVLADESYDRFVYDGKRLTSILTLRGRSDRLVLVRSLSKSHALATWRVGYIVGSPELIDACVTVLEWEILHCAYVAQRVAAAVLNGPQEWLGDPATEYQTNRDAVLAAVADSSWLSCIKPAAGAFLFLDTGCRADRGSSSPEERLLRRGVPTVPGRYFQAPGYLRLSFGGTPETIRRLCDILSEIAPDG